MSSAHSPPPEVVSDDFFEQILSMPVFGVASGGASATRPHLGSSSDISGGGAPLLPRVFPLGLSLEHSNTATPEELKEERDSVQLSTFSPMLRHLQSHQIGPNPTQIFQGQLVQEAVAAPTQLPAARSKVRARRGQATDPHSIAERLRRERITERFKALQELLPNINKTDRAVMLDEVVDYVKFLRLQQKILSMSRLGGAGAMAHIAADAPYASSVEGDFADGGNKQFWEKWSDNGTERQVVKLMEEDIGAALQFLQSKDLCIMPISLAAAIYRANYKVEEAKIEPDESVPP